MIANEMFVEAFASSSKILGKDHAETFKCAVQQAFLHELNGHCGEAEPLYEYALEERKRHLGPEHPETSEKDRTFGKYFLALRETQ